jgi:endonuclease I/endonuclease/exonuclease/phosphatase family metal-dependent hydrolase
MFSLIGQQAWGQIATWTFETSVVTPASNDANITASSVSEGSGLGSIGFATGNGSPTARTANSFTTATSVDADDYYEITLTPNSGYEIDFTSFSFDERRSGTGIRNWAVRSSLDSYASDISSGSVPDDTNFRTQTVDLSGTTYQGINAAITFRIYGYGAEAGTGTWRIDNLTVSGTVNSTGASSDKDITAFKINISGTDYNGVIDEGATPNPTIIVELPNGTDLSSLTPDVTHEGDSYAPTSAQDFTNSETTPIEYTVTAEDASTKVYDVTVTAAEPAAIVIISQVYEGLSNSKWIELANIGSVTADLSNYKVRLWANATSTGGSPTSEVTLSGTLASGATFVIKRSTATLPSGITEDLINDGVTGFNGEGSSGSNNDLIALTQTDNTILDLFGVVGTLYKDKSFYRKLSVVDVNDTYTSAEWTEVTLATVDAATGNVVEKLGYHGVNNSKQITAFSLTVSPCGSAQVVNGTIDQDAETISLTVPFGSTITSLTPSITYSGASISPSGAQDFSSPVVYTVTAQDASTKDYTVTVSTASASTEANITDFKFTISSIVYAGTIDEGATPNPTISVELPIGTNVSSLTPTITSSSCSNVSPSGAQDFSSAVNYTVTAQDGTTTKTYTVNVTFAAPSSEKDILTFVINSANGVISGTDITVTLPTGTSITSLTPTITVSDFASVSPNSGVSQNFTNDVTYTVTAQDASTKEYTVSVVLSDDYYASAYGLTGYVLKTALHNIIKDSHSPKTYGDLWTFYSTYEIDTEEGAIWDMYSENPSGADPYNFTAVTEQCGSYTQEGDCYNREHSFPRSWFGGQIEPMNSDVHHIFPTDGYVNAQRGSYPYGEVGTASYTSANGSKLGSAASGLGFTGTVFEPLDEYKGDFARAQFYMATRYQDLVDGWESNSTNSDDVLNGTEDQAFEDWYLAMLIDWHNNDPVDAKETARNEAAYTHQVNRNPYIDHPEWVAEVWLNDSPLLISGTLENFGTVAFGNESSEQSYTVSGTELAENIVITAPEHFQISTTSGSGFTDMLTLTIDGSGNVSATTIYVKFVPASAFGTTITASISHVSGAESANQVVNAKEGNGLVNLPLIEYFDACGIPADWTSYSVTSNKNWACQSSTVRSGNSLQMNGFSGDADSEDWLITPKLNVSTAFEVVVSFYATTRFSGANPTLMFSSDYNGVSNPNNATWTTLMEISGLDGTESTFEEVSYTGNFAENGYFAIKYTGTASSSQRFTVDDFSVTGNTTGISLSGTINDFGYVVFGNESSEQSYTVEAAGLTADLTITAPTNFQISQSSGSGFTNSIVLTKDGSGNIAATTIYVKFVPASATGAAMTGAITHVSADQSRDLDVSGTEGVEPVNLFYEPFEDGTWISTWINQSVNGKNVWAERSYNNNKYAQMSAYQGDATEEDWIVSPAINLDISDEEVFTFQTKGGYDNGDPLTVWYTTDWTGDVTTTTWTQITAGTIDISAPSNGYSDNFTNSGNIDFSGIAGTIRLAFKYVGGTSGITTTMQVDEVKIAGLEDTSVPRLSVSPTSLSFPKTPLPDDITAKDVTLTAKYLQAGDDVNVSASENFEVSINNGTDWFTEVTIPLAEANGKVIKVRPLSSITRDEDYFGTISLEVAVSTNAVNTSFEVEYIGTKEDANDLTKEETLDIVSWNVEWFGEPDKSNNATSFSEQLTEVSTKMISLDADIYALQEVIQTPSDNYLSLLIDELNTLAGSEVYDGFYGDKYSYYWTEYDPSFPPQKLAFVYKKATVTIVESRSLLDEIHDGTSDVADFDYAADNDDSKLWSSGRLPFEVIAEVNIGGVKRMINLVNVHGKCCPDSKSRKEADSQVLLDSLNAYAANRNVIILGDFNDYMNGSMSGGTSPYANFLADDYTQVVGKDNEIDHILVSSEMLDEFNTLSNNVIYETTTVSDHDPIMGRFLIDELPTLTITVEDDTKIYGEANPTFSVTYDGFVDPDNSSILEGFNTFETSATASSNVGDYEVSASGVTSVLYDIEYVSGTLTIEKAPLTISVDDVSKFYGSPNPTFTVSYDSFVNGDDADDLTGTLEFSTTAVTLSPVGDYEVTVDGVSSDNYDITFEAGTLTINEVPCNPITGLIANGGTNMFTLSWDAFDGATAYTVKVYFVETNALAYSATATSNSWSKTEAIAGNYYWAVEAVTGACGAGTTLAEGSSFVVTSCVAFTTTSSKGGANSFEVAWTPISGVSSYTVKIYHANGTWFNTITTEKNIVQWANIPEGNYYWTISFTSGACNANIYGGKFNILSCIIMNNLSGLSGTGESSSFTIRWNAISGEFSGFYRYNYRVKLKGSTTWTYRGRASTTSYTETRVPAGIYEWEVYANLFGAPNSCFGVWKKGKDFTVISGSSVAVRESDELIINDVLADNIEFVNFGATEEEIMLETSIDFTVYPNPSRGVVSFQLNDFEGAGKLEIFNLMGQVVYSQEVSAGEQIQNKDFSAQAKGMYIARLSANGSVQTQKFVIE